MFAILLVHCTFLPAAYSSLRKQSQDLNLSGFVLHALLQFEDIGHGIHWTRLQFALLAPFDGDCPYKPVISRSTPKLVSVL